jgi:hypothetical protein
MNNEDYNENYQKIRRNVIKKLYANKTFGSKHLLYERLLAGIPGHLAGQVKDVVNGLVKENIVLLYAKTKHGKAYQLNIKKIKDIEDIVFSYKDK